MDESLKIEKLLAEAEAKLQKAAEIATKAGINFSFGIDTAGSYQLQAWDFNNLDPEDLYDEEGNTFAGQWYTSSTFCW